MFLVNFIIILLLIATTNTTPVGLWTGGPLQQCPQIESLKHLRSDQIKGVWRLAYLFLDQTDESLDEETSCIVLDLIPSNNSTDLTLSMFIDTVHDDRIERSSAAFSAIANTPSEWLIYAPLARDGSIRARVILATEESMIITFCSTDHPRQFVDNDEIALGKVKPYSDDGDSERNKIKNSMEQGLDWKTALFQGEQKLTRAKRNLEESHLWTIILVKHNNVSALKFVEYASVLMKHGFDVTKGELISFGKCPATVKSQSKSNLFNFLQ